VCGKASGKGGKERVDLSSHSLSESERARLINNSDYVLSDNVGQNLVTEAVLKSVEILECVGYMGCQYRVRAPI
jgi:hypothetical protein